MFSRLQQRWRRFCRSQPGSRFCAYHERRQRRGSTHTRWGRFRALLAGTGLLLLGGLFAILPGPALIFIIPGAILLASEFAWAARALDWLDVRLTPVIIGLARRWRRLPRATRLGVQAITICGAVVSMVVGILVTIR